MTVVAPEVGGVIVSVAPPPIGVATEMDGADVSV
jgi:hypothetical protein